MNFIRKFQKHLKALSPRARSVVLTLANIFAGAGLAAIAAYLTDHSELLGGFTGIAIVLVMEASAYIDPTNKLRTLKRV